MIATALIEGQDFTQAVLRGGIEELTFEAQDEEGVQTIGSATASFSNLDGGLTQFLGTKGPIMLDLTVGGVRVYRGQADPNEVTFDEDDESVQMQTVDATVRSAVDRLKEIKIGQKASTSQYAIVYPRAYVQAIHAETNSLYGDWLPRAIFSVRETLARLDVDFGVSTFPIDEYFIGGAILLPGTSDEIRRTNENKAHLPDWSAWEFVQEVVRLCNGFVTGENGRLTIRSRRSLFARDASVLSLPLLKNSYRQTNKRAGCDGVTLRYANWTSELIYTYLSFGAGSVGRELGSWGQGDFIPKEVQLKSKMPSTAALVRSGNGVAYISQDQDSCDYLFWIADPTVWTSERVSDPGRPGSISPQDLLTRGYLDELEERKEFEAEYSLMDQDALVQELALPFRAIAHPLNPLTRCHVRSAVVDLEHETVKVKAFGPAV